MSQKSANGVGPKARPRTTPDDTSAMTSLRRAPGSHLSIVPISEVLDSAEMRWRQGAPKDRFDRERRTAILSKFARLRPFWGKLRVRDIKPWGETKGTIDRYVLMRTKGNEGSESCDDESLVSVTTALNEVATLRTEINHFKAEQGLIGDVVWNLPKGGHAPVEWLERDEVARLLWAIRGRVWDQETNTWAVDEKGSRIIQKRSLAGVQRRRWDATKGRWVSVRGRENDTVNARAWLARLILFLVYTGSTASCATRLRWPPSSDKGSGQADLDEDASYVDLDTILEGRSGHLYRRGTDLASSTMAGVPVALSRRLVSHLRRWRAADSLHSFGYFLHLSGSDPWNKASPQQPFAIKSKILRRIWEQAGLSGESILSRLSCTAVVWVLRSGMRTVAGQPRFEPAPAIMRSAALMIGKDYMSFMERFRCIMPDFLKKQVDALSSLPEVVK